MKKCLLIFLIILFSVGSAFCGEFKDTLKKAEQGDADAQYRLGFMYYRGKVITEDYKLAHAWWTKAAEQGIADAQFSLGYMYFRGQGVTKDYKLSHVWYSLAAAQGNKEAIHNRDDVAKRFLPHQLIEAQELAAQIHRRIENQKKQE